MAKIRHLAIKAEDQEQTATFYKQTFGMAEAWRGPVREDGHRAIYLTDGYINMAILPARGGREGIDHFGFQVEDLEGTLKTAASTGAKAIRTKNHGMVDSRKWACRTRWGLPSTFPCTAGKRRQQRGLS
jgi:catechol 2,3-dioxygenase-like lactoylglutathione lyase family enzyme